MHRVKTINHDSNTLETVCGQIISLNNQRSQCSDDDDRISCMVCSDKSLILAIVGKHGRRNVLTKDAKLIDVMRECPVDGEVSLFWAMRSE